MSHLLLGAVYTLCNVYTLTDIFFGVHSSKPAAAGQGHQFVSIQCYYSYLKDAFSHSFEALVEQPLGILAVPRLMGCEMPLSNLHGPLNMHTPLRHWAAAWTRWKGVAA